MVVGLLGLSMLVGCTPESVDKLEESSPTPNVNQESAKESSQEKQTTEDSASSPNLGVNEEADKAKEQADNNAEKVDEEVKSILNLKLLMGEKSDKVRDVLGTPKESENLEETQILLSDKFVKEVVGQKVSVEVVYDDAEGKANFINIKCVKTDNVKSFIAKFESELVQKFGEGSIEKTIDVRGTKRKEWEDETLTYALSYIENDVTLDIYPIHE